MVVAPGPFDISVGVFAFQDESLGYLWEVDVHWEIYQENTLILKDSIIAYDAGGLSINTGGGPIVADVTVEVLPASYTTVKAWTNKPNGVVGNDYNHDNDTAFVHLFSAEPSGGASALFNREGYSRLEVPGTAGVAMGSQFTLEAWFKPLPDDSLRFTILCKEGEFQIGRNSCNLQFAVNNTSDTWQWVSSRFCAPVNQWNHVALTYDNGLAILYVNGFERARHLYTGTLVDEVPDFDEFWIGGRENNPLRSFDGFIDEVRWWNVARTPEQLRTWLMRRDGLETEPGLFAVWSFGEESGASSAYEPINGLTAYAVNGAELGHPGAPVVDGPLVAEDLYPEDIVGVDTAAILPEGTFVPSVVVRNGGSTSASAFTLHWDLDGQLGNTPWNGNLVPGQTTTIGLGTLPLPAGIVHHLAVWTEMAGDEDQQNDTLRIDPFFADPSQSHQALALGQPGGINNGGSATVASMAGLPVGSSARTFEFWVNPGNPSETLFGYGGQQTTNDRFYVSRLSSGEVRVSYGNNSTFQLTSTAIVPIGVWSHVAITYSGFELKLFVNGLLVGQNAVDLNTANSAFCLGRYPTSVLPNAWFDGSLDEVRVWSVARTSQQLREWMVKTVGIEQEPGLVAAWSFTEPVGSTSTYDRVANVEAVLEGAFAFSSAAAPVADDPPQADLAILALVAPQSGCDHGSAESVIARVRNLGTAPVSSFTLGFIQNGTVIHSEPVDTVVAPGATAELTMSQAADLSNAPLNTFVITISTPEDGNGLNDSLEVIIQTYPGVIASVDDDLSICAGDSVTLHAAGGSAYLWSTGVPSPNILVDPLTSITYSVTVSNGFGCSAVDSVRVTVVPLPPQPTITADEPSLCPGDTIELSTSASPVQWSNGSQQPFILVSNAGSYHVESIDTLMGCRNRSLPAVITDTPALQIVPLGPTAVCEGDELGLVALNAGAIAWSFTASSNDTVIYAPTVVGVDTVLLTGTSSGGCTAPARIVLNVVPSVPLAQVTEMLPYDGALHVALNTTFSFQPVPNASSFLIQYWPSGTQDTLGIATTATNNPVSGLLSHTSYNWRVSAANSCQTSSSTVRSFTTTGQIDLVMDTLMAPVETTAGYTIPVTYAVANRGTGPTGYQSWQDRVYLSTDNDLRIGDDLLLVSVPNLTYLDTAQVYQRTLNVTIPLTLSGTYYLYVITDNDDAYCWTPADCANGITFAHHYGLSELNERNNERYVLLSIAIPPTPDLICTSVGSATNVNSNAQLPVVYGLANIGDLVIQDRTVRNVLYLSSDSIAFEPVNLFGSIAFGGSGGTFSAPNVRGMWHDVHIGTLAPGDTMYVPVSLPPPSTLDGQYYMFVWIDRKDSIYEAAGEFNNFLMRDGPVNVLPAVCDLEGVLGGSNGAYPNDTLLVLPYTYFNNLNEAPPGNNFVNKLYLSTDATLDVGTDQLIAVQQRADGLQMDTTAYVGTGAFSWQVPANLIGQRYLIASFDANDDFFEDVTANNIKSRLLDFYLRVNAPLSLASVTPSNPNPLSGETITLAVQGSNAGPHDVDRPMELGIYRSTVAVFDEQTAELVATVEYATGDLQAGQVINEVVQVTIPDGYSGPLYYHAFIDHEEALFELNEADNIADAPITVGLADYPDLRIGTVNAPDTITPATDLTVNYWVRNEGATQATGMRMDRFVLSPNGILGDSGDREMGTEESPTSIAPGDSAQFTAVLDVPFDFAPIGTYQLFVATDSDNDLYEHDGVAQADNNNASSPRSVAVEPSWTDVAITMFTASADTVSSGTTLTASITVVNQGAYPASNSIRVDRIYLSNDSVVAGPWYGAAALPNLLEPGESYTKTFAITAPNGYQGDYVLVARTDDVGACVNDSVPENNLDYLPLFVELTPPCDLQITEMEVLAAPPIYAGQGVQVQYTVNNVLPDSAHATWTDKLFINSAPTLNGALALAQRTHQNGLAGNEGYTSTFNVVLPGAMSGSRYLILVTDVYNAQYEHLAESNNDSIQPIFLNVPLPTDLVVNFVDGPDQWLLGETDAVTLRVKNIGANVAVGLLGNNVFFSQDASLNTLMDPLFATIQQPVFISPGDSSEFTITRRLVDVDPGLYHYLGQTNAQASLHETNFSNNEGASVDLVNVDMTEILLGGSTNTALNQGDLRYYKVYVPTPGLDLLVTLDSDQEFGHNQVYHAHGHVPSVTDYDHAQEFETATDQQVLIPSADTGWHYLLATTSITYAIDQEVVLSVVGLPLSIIEIRPPLVGQGPVTLTLIGARFSEESVFQLIELDGDDIQVGAIVSFVNSMRVAVFFDFTGVPLGDYRIRVLDSGDSQDSQVLLTVELTREEPLDVFIDSPDEVILGRSQVVDIIVTNTSNVNSYMDRISVVIPPTSDFTVGPHDPFFRFGEFELGLDTSFVLMPEEHDGFARHLSYALDRRPPGSEHHFRLTLPEIDYFNRTMVVLVDNSSMNTFFTETLRRADALRSSQALFNLGLIPAEWQDFMNDDAAMLDSLSAWLEASDLMEVDIVACDSLGLSPSLGCAGTCYAAIVRDTQTGHADTLSFQIPLCDADSEGAADVAYYNGDPCEMADVDGLDNIDCDGGDGSDFGGADGSSGGVTDDPSDGSNEGEDIPGDEGGQNGGGNGGGEGEGIGGNGANGGNGRPPRQEFTCMWWDACPQIRWEQERALMRIHKQCREPEESTFWYQPEDLGLARSKSLWNRILGGNKLGGGATFFTDMASFGCDAGFFWTMNKIISEYYKCSAVRSSCDPNVLLGPNGHGSAYWMQSDSLLRYSVHYENDSIFATASANNVEIRLAISEKYDLSSFRIGSWNVGGTEYEAPGNLMALSNQFMHNGTLVNLTAGVDVPNREAYWFFESLDPQTLLPPSDPNGGYLPINDSLGSGQGFVTFTIRPSASAQTGDSLSAQAEIIFDINEPILTNVWTNLLDAEGPNSQVDSLVSVNDSTIVVHYTATDPNDGSGVERVDVYASEAGGPMELVVTNLHPDSSYTFSGTPGLEYCFATLAYDTVLYAEELPTQPDQCITLVPQAFSLVSPAVGASVCEGGDVSIIWGAGDISSFNLSFSSDSGQTFVPIVTGVSGPTYIWNLPAWVQPGTGIVVRVADASDASAYVQSGLFTVHPLPPAPAITANGPTEFCQGGQVQLVGPSGYTGYQWSPQGPNAFTSTVGTSGTYSLAVTDVNGCTSMASNAVPVVVHPLPEAPEVTPNPAEFCEGDSLQLTAEGGLTDYNWSSGQSGSSIWVNNSVNMQVTGTDDEGCTSAPTQVAVTEWPLPGTPMILLGADTLCSSITAESYQWYWEGNAVSSEACTPLTWAGVYWLYVSNGPCMDSAVFIITDVADGPVGSGLTIAPNPNAGHFDLGITDAEMGPYTLMVRSAVGQLVYRTSGVATAQRVSVPLRITDLATGIYSLEVTQGRRSMSIRFTVDR